MMGKEKEKMWGKREQMTAVGVGRPRNQEKRTGKLCVVGSLS